MLRLQRVLDKATGYVYVEKEESSTKEPKASAQTTKEGSKRGTAASAGALFTVADRGVPLGWGSAADVQERWVDHRDEWHDFEIKEREEMEQRWKRADDSEPTTSTEAAASSSIGSIKERSS